MKEMNLLILQSINILLKNTDSSMSCNFNIYSNNLLRIDINCSIYFNLLLALLFAAARTPLLQNCRCYASLPVVAVLCSRLYLHRPRSPYTLQSRCVQHIHIQSPPELDASNSHTMSRLMLQTC